MRCMSGCSQCVDKTPEEIEAERRAAEQAERERLEAERLERELLERLAAEKAAKLEVHYFSPIVTRPKV